MAEEPLVDDPALNEQEAQGEHKLHDEVPPEAEGEIHIDPASEAPAEAAGSAEAAEAADEVEPAEVPEGLDLEEAKEQAEPFSPDEEPHSPSGMPRSRESRSRQEGEGLAIEEVVNEDEASHINETVEPSVPRNRCIDWIRDKIDVEGYTKQMWREEYNELVNEFLEEEDTSKLFFWIDPSLGLTVSNSTPPQLTIEDSGFMYFLKPAGLNEPVTLDNIQSVLLVGFIDGPSLDALLDYMRMTFIPVVKKEVRWPESVKKEFMGQMHKFMSSITEATHKSKGKTVLYVPEEEFNDPEVAAADKDLVQRLESTLINWTRQIRDVVNNQDLQQENENAGPLEEIFHWQKRTTNLSFIHDQLERPELKRVLLVLQHADSSYLKVFNDLASHIERGTIEANDNLTHLQTLNDPCKKLENAKPNEVAQIVPDILERIKTIWETSQFYNTPDRVTGLLRKISNEIINRCITIINVDDMLGQDVLKCMDDLEESKRCCEGWKVIFERTATAIQEGEGKPWHFSKGSIFSQVEAFIQRCVDLNQICEGQLQFARKDSESQALPHFGGTRGHEIVKNLLEIERSFKKNIERIKGLNYLILDVKITRWHSDYNKFKLRMKDLETMFINTINFALEGVTTVFQGVEMLEAFDNLSKRATIKQHVQDMAITVYDKFTADLDLVKKEYDNRESPPLWTFHPRYGGTALWARSLITRIERQKQDLDKLVFITDDKAIKKRDLVFAKYAKSHETLKQYVSNTMYRKWTDEIEEMKRVEGLPQRMEKPVFKGDSTSQILASQQSLAPIMPTGDLALLKKTKHGALESNFDKGLMKLVAEAKCWEKLQSFGILIPSEVHEVATSREDFRVLRENVLLVVKDYNMIMEVLNESEKLLFDQHISNLNQKLKPGWSKSIKWNNRNVVDNSIREWRRQCADCFEKVLRYKQNTDKLLERCREVADMQLLLLEKKSPYSEGQLELKQSQFLAALRPRLLGLIEEIRRIMHDTSLLFLSPNMELLKTVSSRKSQEEVAQEWYRYVEDKDRVLEEALKKAVRSSLTELNKAINGDGKTDPTPIFRMNTIFDEANGRADFKPTRKELRVMIDRIITGLMQITEGIPRLEQKFYEDFTRGKEEASEAQGFGGASNFVRRAEDAVTLGAEIENIIKRTPKKSFFENISKDHDIRSVTNRTLRGIDKCSNLIEEHLVVWMKDPYRMLWTTAKVPYFKRLLEQKPDLKTFEEYIQHYNSLMNEHIITEKTTIPVLFVLIDHTNIKETLLQYCREWIIEHTMLLNNMARQQLVELHQLFDKSTQELMMTPVSHRHYKDMRERLTDLKGNQGDIKSKIAPIFKKYEHLQSHEVEYTPEEEQMLADLESKFNDWKEMLARSEVALDKTHKDYERDVRKSWEEYMKQVTENKNNFQQSAPFSTDKFENKDAKKVINEYRSEQATLKKHEDDMQFSLRLFEIPTYALKDLADVDRDLNLLEEIWGIKVKWDEQWATWRKMKFYDLNVDDMQEVAENFVESVMKLGSQIKQWGIWNNMNTNLQIFMNTLPLIRNLKSKAIKDRHWEDLKSEVKQQFDEKSNHFTLETVFNLGLHQYGDFITEMAGLARQQMSIEEALTEILTVWGTLDLNVVEYKGRYYRISKPDDIFAMLEEHIVKLSSMKSQFFAKPFLDEIGRWEKTLSHITETIELLLQVQQQWIYLESIFIGQDDIKKQLSNEHANFMQVNEKFMEEMSRIQRDPNAQRALCHPNFLDVLGRLNKHLDNIQKNLDQYLNNKRKKFPRFYFLSSDDLLAILGQNKNPAGIQPHIKKLFEGVKKLELTEKPGEKRGTKIHEITELISGDGERVRLAQKITIEGAVELWLIDLEKMMKKTLKGLLQKCYQECIGKSDRWDWIKNWQGMLLITAGQVKWTQETTKHLINYSADTSKANPLKAMKKSQHRFIKKLVEYVRRPMAPAERNKIVALITIEQHAREVLDHLFDLGISSPIDFEWMQQLRLERDESSTESEFICNVKQTNTNFPYGYEYQGNNGRLVVTPLTERCYMTLTTALQLKRGGAPQGPAGTGKTETVKDLGKNIAKFVVVINCSDQMDFSSLGRTFSGLAQSGSWGCFDEFNRIEVEVLSVIAIQISKIQMAIKEGREDFKFEKDHISLDRSCGIFITMNPTYAGRSDLPDNLKSLFRPISMMTADLQLISENMMLSEGFQQGKTLSKKMITLYSLMTQQFSKEKHYDFGMRALKSVLNCAGNMKREQPELNESMLLLKAIYDMNLPKLVAEDVELFTALLRVIFDVELSDAQNEILRSAIVRELEANKLQATDMIVLKCLQLYETKRTRHGNMLVGQTLSGKSTVWRTLAAAQSALAKQGVPGYNKVINRIMNPKAIDMKELYGWNDASMEWHDGTLSHIMRQLCSDEGEDAKWFILDGPVDTLWIESMNTVLDDNKLLTLINGDRISLPPSVRLLFEVENLDEASPATVSRAGMIYIDVNVHTYRPYLDSWLMKKNDPDHVAFLEDQFKKYLPKVFECKRTQCKELVRTSRINNIISFTKIYDAFFNDAGIPQNDDRYWALAEKWFIFALVWSVGATVDEDGRETLNNLLTEIESGFPHSGTIYDYTVNLEKIEWMNWSDKLTSKFNIPAGKRFLEILIPTVDTLRYLFLMEGLVKAQNHVLIVGTTGTGKTALIDFMLQNLDENTYMHFAINFSAQTSSLKTQEIIESSLEKRTSNKRGPSANKRCVLFVDDLNMPRKDKYGSQPPLELLRQWIDYGYWYDRQKQIEMYILDTKMLAAMGPPGGGRSEISARMQSQFRTINFTQPSDGQMSRIFHTIISHHLSDFEEEVKPLADPLTIATISLYRRVSEVFLPTPTKSHYLFNMREISRVFQGLYRADRAFHDSKESLVKLWTHECLRVFHDRLINYEDQNIFKQLMDEQLESQFTLSYKSCCLRILDDSGEVFFDPLFADFIGEMKVYEEITDREAMKVYLTGRLEEYNNTPRNIEMNLVLFKEAVSYLCKINRIIKQSRGHCLLVGVGGSGRHSTTRLAAYVAGYEVVQLEINKNYRLAEFREDIKRMNWKAGVENKPVVFIFSDNDVVNESFLEDVNNILSAGEVPNIYNADDLVAITDGIKKAAKDNAPIPFFTARMKDNLHVAFCISPIGDSFRNYIRMYPGLVNNTTINWFMPWPQDALYEVAKKFLTERLDFDEAMNLNISKVFGNMHVDVEESSRRMLSEYRRYNYVTPTHYLELVLGYVRLLRNKQKEIGEEATKLRNGLLKLVEAREEVQKMSIELEVKKGEANKKQKDCEELLIKINQEQSKAEKSQKEVEKKTEEIEKEKIEVESVAAEAQADLDKALPALEQAEAALAKMDKGKVAEVKAYTNPPKAVETVMEVVMIILGVRPPTWQNAKKELGDPDFLKRIVNYPKDSIPNALIKSIEKYTKREDFKPEVIFTQSQAASFLCQWVHALELYAKTFRDVEPKRIKLNTLRANLQKMTDRLNELKDTLEGLLRTIGELQANFNGAEAEMDSAKKEANELQLKLERAEKLVLGLANERERWESSILELDNRFKLLPGDCLISAGFLSYLGPFTSNFRDDLVEIRWIPMVARLKIPMNKDFTITSFMASQSEIREWNLQKLPTDKFSIENGILTLRSRRWALMIDPQSQANTWIKNHVGADLKIFDPKMRYSRLLEDSVRYGQSVLLQDVEEEIDPALDPILNQSVQRRGQTYTMKLGDKELEYNFNFRFFMTTKMSNPHYTPEISTKVTIINFQVKESGLEEQLLGIVVREEQPKLESDKDQMVISIADNNRKKIEFENQILARLSSLSGSLLDNEELINTLQQSKINAEEANMNLEVAESTIRKINTTREEYRPCATRASVLFFVLANLYNIDPMYQFSLQTYIELFQDSIRKSKERNPVWDSTNERIVQLDKFHMYSVYSSTCRALFEKHKMLLSLQMCVELAKLQGTINVQEYDFFLRGGVIIGDIEQTPNPDPEWITREMWDNITVLEMTVSTFQGIEGAMIVSKREWKRWFKTSDPENQPLPGEWDAKADELRRMVLLRCLRPDRVGFAATSYVTSRLGPEYVDPPPFVLERIYTDSSRASQPLLFVLFPGVDPSPQLASLAKEKGRLLETVPLGRGQSGNAISAVTDACEKGYWVFLANCHLSISWMPELEKLIETQITKGNPHENFRLWLSSDPTPKFPISILQVSVKMTTEPPKGIKANMLRMFNSITARHYTRVVEQAKYKKMVYALCWFHSVLIERKKFKTLGWNEAYSFNDSDFEVSENILAMYLGNEEEKSNISIDTKNTNWDAIRFLISDISYGGRVTDDRDRKLLGVYASEFFNAKVSEEVKYKLSDGVLPYVIPDSTNYKLPPDVTNFSHFYIEYIRTFPNTEKPEAFGQHVNAEIASQRSDSRELLESILKLQPQTAVGGDDRREEKVLALCSDLLEKIPEPLNLEEITERWRRDDGPLKVVLLQEIARYNILLNYLRDQLNQLIKGIKGLVVISTELESTMNSAYENRIPESWQFAYPSIKPLASWVRDLALRIKSFQDWAYGQVPNVYWLASFTYPTGFTTALMQQTSARLNCTIDTLYWDFVVIQQTEQNIFKGPTDGAYIKGLFLEGAKWKDDDGGFLFEPEPMELVWPMPIIHFKPIKDKKKGKQGNIYQCPCYIYPIRTGSRERPSYILSVDLKCGETTPEFWVKRGTALLLSLDS